MKVDRGEAALRALVRRDVRLFAAAAALAVVAVAAIVAWGLDWLGSPAPALVIGILAIVVGAGGFAAGPRIRDRVYLLGPAFLAITPTVVALGALGGPALAFFISFAVALAATFAFVRGGRRA